jgi:metal iron transporter
VENKRKSELATTRKDFQLTPSISQPIVRRIITRAISIIPSVVVAVAVGRSGVNQLLVASQVCLSVVLPFVVFPLVWICADKNVMTVRNSLTEASEDGFRSTRTRQLGLGRNNDTDAESSALAVDDADAGGSDPHQEIQGDRRVIREVDAAAAPDSKPPKSKSFTSHWIATVLGYALFVVVTVR